MVADAIRLLLFPALMAFAASSDLITMTISNRISLALIASFFVLAYMWSMPLAEIATLSSAAADQFAFNAASIAATRITPLCEAPVAATLTSPALVLATNTPVSAKREAGCRILA